MSLSAAQLQSLQRKFRQHHAEDATQLRQASLQGDMQTIQTIAHNLKSVAHYINAPQIQQLAKELDTQVKAGTAPAPLVEALASAIDSVHQTLDTQFSSTNHTG
jgi:HPt (histidine-containing phosphotransfer) domain-containing protein